MRSGVVGSYPVLRIPRIETFALHSGERSAMRVASGDFGESFVADITWMLEKEGTSRIGVCMSRMNDLSRLVDFSRTLRHEVE